MGSSVLDGVYPQLQHHSGQARRLTLTKGFEQTDYRKRCKNEYGTRQVEAMSCAARVAPTYIDGMRWSRSHTCVKITTSRHPAPSS